MNSHLVQGLMQSYYCGKSINEVAKENGLSAGKAYYILRDAGCVFRTRGHPKGWKPSEEHIQQIKASRIGSEFSETWRSNISKAKKSTYNGMNGYGHTKPHCRGYILAYAPLHPNAHKDGYIMEHTVIMERHIGRQLKDNEVVHHINHKRDDNRIENLLLMDKKEHQSMHMHIRNNQRRNDLSTV